MSMELLRSEDVISLAMACEEFPGCTPNRSTLRDWILDGVHGHKLAAFTVGRRYYTSRQAIDRFIRATSAAAGCNADGAAK
jgi:hypothetical protein